MKILVVQESDWIKRNPHQQHHLMELLGLRGHQIHVIDYEVDWKIDKKNSEYKYKSPRQEFNKYKKIYNTENVTVIRPPLIKLPVFNYLSILHYHKQEIKRQIKEFEPDVIVGFGILNASIASKIAKKENIPFVYYFIDVLHELIPEKIFRNLGKRMIKNTIRRSSYVLTINRKLNETAAELGANPHKMSIIGAGINLKQFNYQKHNGYKIRKYYHINNNDIVLFFMGFLYNFAGLKELAMELGKNKGKYPNIKLMIVGDGDSFEALQLIQKKYNLEDQMILTGRQKYKIMPDLIGASDICILPAHQDEIIMQNIVPIKLYEYMAMKKPVIATKLPGLVAEFGEQNGLVYINHAEEVLELVNKKFNNKREIVKVGLAGYNFIEDNDWRKLTMKFESILEGLILDLLLKDI
ncbi:glycosyltransferase [Methanosphaera sp. WGK6]|uniref:glycosyltransferase n=1 Tax=Methanosphaera sp. WGK6 TaxID=1561964 RepID=UPI00084C50D6|nr:glycosyltransferase [Methanosphaera sp. WGK6]OED30843.1 glycosyl transferase GT4 family protein [Methanosphaera sp. WGK6]